MGARRGRRAAGGPRRSAAHGRVRPAVGARMGHACARARGGMRMWAHARMGPRPGGWRPRGCILAAVRCPCGPQGRLAGSRARSAARSSLSCACTPAHIPAHRRTQPPLLCSARTRWGPATPTASTRTTCSCRSCRWRQTCSGARGSDAAVRRATRRGPSLWRTAGSPRQAAFCCSPELCVKRLHPHRVIFRTAPAIITVSRPVRRRDAVPGGEYLGLRYQNAINTSS